jgi:hypothetical protein
LSKTGRADPGDWRVPSYVAKDFAEKFIHERASMAKALNKPFILEETGKDVRLSCLTIQSPLLSACHAMKRCTVLG